MDRLARQRAATYRFWREDAESRPGGAWAQLGGVQLHTTGLAQRQWNGAFLTAPTCRAVHRRTVTLVEDGQPVATASLALAGPAAGVYDVAVLPSAQGRGLGTAATSWCLQQAAREGADLAYLNPSEAGHRLYARLGFVDAAPFQIWSPP